MTSLERVQYDIRGTRIRSTMRAVHWARLFVFGLVTLFGATFAVPSEATTESDISRALAQCNASLVGNPPAMSCQCYLMTISTDAVNHTRDVELRKKCINGDAVLNEQRKLIPGSYIHQCPSVCTTLHGFCGTYPDRLDLSSGLCDHCGALYVPIIEYTTIHCDGRITTDYREVMDGWTMSVLDIAICNMHSPDLTQNCQPVDTLMDRYLSVCKDDDPCCKDPICCSDPCCKEKNKNQDATSGR